MNKKFEIKNENRNKNASDEFKRAKFYAQLFFSIVILGVAIFVLLSKQYDDELNKWAFAMVGLITGYWLSGVK